MGRGSTRQWFEDSEFAGDLLCFCSKYSITFLMQGTLRVFIFFIILHLKKKQLWGKPKRVSFENLLSVITVSSFCSIFGARIFSCRIVVNEKGQKNFFCSNNSEKYFKSSIWELFSGFARFLSHQKLQLIRPLTIPKSLFSNCNQTYNKTLCWCKVGKKICWWVPVLHNKCHSLIQRCMNFLVWTPENFTDGWCLWRKNHVGKACSSSLKRKWNMELFLKKNPRKGKAFQIPLRLILMENKIPGRFRKTKEL